MNKKIKVIDLINIIAKNQDIPQRIRVDKDIYNWDIEEFYKREDGKDLFVLADFYNTIGFLELEVEILEDNTEEIEELATYREIEEFGELDKRCINQNAKDFFYKINELVKIVNALRKEKE